MTLHPDRMIGHLPPPTRIDHGVPGLFHRGTHGRRVSHRSAVWRLRERRLGWRLEHELAGAGMVLHSRHAGSELDCQPIDHLVVLPAGVWAIRADHLLDRLTLDAATASVARAEAEARNQAAACRYVLASIGFDWLDVHLAVCATNAQGVLRRPLRIGDIWVARPRALLDVMSEAGPLAQRDVSTVTAELSRRFPAAH